MPSLPPEEIAHLMKFIAEKAKNVKSPMNIKDLAIQYKEAFETPVRVDGLKSRIEKYRHEIHKMNEFDMDTKVKLMFVLSGKLDDGFLNELKKQAEVKVDEKGRIKKYKANNGCLELEGRHGPSSSMKNFYSNRWQKICDKVNDDESEEDEDEDWETDDEKKKIVFVKFLIEQTKNAKSPMSLKQMAKDYVAEFGSSDSILTVRSRIRRFRQRIHEMNQIDMTTKVRTLFALSAPIDADFLKKLENDAIVELDEKMRIKKYKTKDGSFELEGDHSMSAKSKAVLAKMKKKVANNLSDSEDSESVISQYLHSIPKGRKRARQVSEEEESLKLEDDSETNFDTKNPENPLNDVENLDHIPVERKPESLIDTNNSDDFDYDPSNYELDMDHLPIDKKPENLIEVKTEESSTNIVGNHYEENFFQYDLQNDDMEHIPAEKKPQSLLEVKTELPEEPSTSNPEYHFENNSEHFLIEPKPETI